MNPNNPPKKAVTLNSLLLGAQHVLADNSVLSCVQGCLVRWSLRRPDGSLTGVLKCADTIEWRWAERGAAVHCLPISPRATVSLMAVNFSASVLAHLAAGTR